jgi:hypothetical protein
VVRTERVFRKRVLPFKSGRDELYRSVPSRDLDVDAESHNPNLCTERGPSYESGGHDGKYKLWATGVHIHRHILYWYDLNRCVDAVAL